MNVINNLCYLAIAVLSGILFVNGAISNIGLITSFLLYVRQFTRPFCRDRQYLQQFSNRCGRRGARV